MKKTSFNNYLKELRRVLKKVGNEDVKNFVEEINKAKRVYVIGAGRSGLMAKNLAMRLVRLKKKTFVIGETVNPPVEKGSLIVAVSGSGETGKVLSAVKVCRVKGARVAGITATKDSPLTKLSHIVVMIEARIPQRLGSQYQLRELVGVPERSPVKSLFEVCTLVFFEVAVSKLNGGE